MGKTPIEWTDLSWPIVNGCRRISPGCQNCYAERLEATRLKHMPKYAGLAMYTEAGPRWTGATRLWEPDLHYPLTVRRPSKIFVADMGDLFYEEVDDVVIEKVFAVMMISFWHTHQVLTKRSERAKDLLSCPAFEKDVRRRAAQFLKDWNSSRLRKRDRIDPGSIDYAWPLANVWVGASVEDRERLVRVDELRQTPAAIRFLSLEPLLEDLGALDLSGIGWVICGGESGHGARPMHPDWPLSIRDQCGAAGVPFFFKQWGEYGWIAELPDEEVRLIDAAVNLAGHPDHEKPWRLGKKRAGRLLDGRTWDEFPAAAGARS